MLCIYNEYAVFDWDENNLRKIRAHRITRGDVEYALSNGPILIYEQNVGSELRFVYYGETDAGRLLAVVLRNARAEFASLLRTSSMPGRRRTILRGGLEGSKP